MPEFRGVPGSHDSFVTICIVAQAYVSDLCRPRGSVAESSRSRNVCRNRDFTARVSPPAAAGSGTIKGGLGEQGALGLDEGLKTPSPVEELVSTAADRRPDLGVWSFIFPSSQPSMSNRATYRANA